MHSWIIYLTREYFSKTFRLEQISDIMSIVCRYQLYLLFITQLYLALGSKNFIDLPHRWNLNGRNIFNQRDWIANRVALSTNIYNDTIAIKEYYNGVEIKNHRLRKSSTAHISLVGWMKLFHFRKPFLPKIQWSGKWKI